LDGLRIDAYSVAIWPVDLHELAVPHRLLKRFADLIETEVDTKDVPTIKLERSLMLALSTGRACWGI